MGYVPTELVCPLRIQQVVSVHYFEYSSNYAFVGEQHDFWEFLYVDKGEVSVRTVPLTPLRDLKEIKGTYAELTARDSYEGTTYRDDYMHIILTDEDDVPEALGKLRVIYRNLMKLEYRNSRTSALGRVTAPEAVRERTPAQLLGELFVKQNDRPMPEEQAAYVRALAAEIWEEDE